MPPVWSAAWGWRGDVVERVHEDADELPADGTCHELFEVHAGRVPFDGEPRSRLADFACVASGGGEPDVSAIPPVFLPSDTPILPDAVFRESEVYGEFHIPPVMADREIAQRIEQVLLGCA